MFGEHKTTEQATSKVLSQSDVYSACGRRELELAPVRTPSPDDLSESLLALVIAVSLRFGNLK